MGSKLAKNQDPTPTPTPDNDDNMAEEQQRRWDRHNCPRCLALIKTMGGQRTCSCAQRKRQPALPGRPKQETPGHKPYHQGSGQSWLHPRGGQPPRRLQSATYEVPNSSSESSDHEGGKLTQRTRISTGSCLLRKTHRNATISRQRMRTPTQDQSSHKRNPPLADHHTTAPDYARTRSGATYHLPPTPMRPGRGRYN